jgi:hypothetical protein
MKGLGPSSWHVKGMAVVVLTMVVVIGSREMKEEWRRGRKEAREREKVGGGRKKEGKHTKKKIQEKGK